MKRPVDIEAAIDALEEMKAEYGDEIFGRPVALGMAIRALKLVDERVFHSAELPEPEDAA
jgi:hypothetical protein